MFLIKEDKQPQPTAFDETHLDVKLSHGRSQLQQIKVMHSWANPAIKVRLPKMNCQWFNKTESSMELITGVTDDCYQPSIIDVGTSIYVQIMPLSKELEYEGMPITRMTNNIQLAAETEEQTKDMLQAGKSTFFVEIKELYIKGLREEDQQVCEGKVSIKECLLKIVKNKIVLLGKTNSMEKADVLLSVQIGEEYPQLQIDRTCGRFLNVLFNSEQYAVFILQNNKIRDIIYLLTKTIQIKHAQNKIEQANSEQKLEFPIPQTVSQVKDNNEDQVKTAEANKRSQQSLPLSPQTIQKQANQSANLIIVSQMRKKLLKAELDAQKYQKQNSKMKQKIRNITIQNEKLTNQLASSRQNIAKLQQQLNAVNYVKQKQKQEMCYMKNQCRLLEQTNESLAKQLKSLLKKLATIQESSKLSQQQIFRYAKYSSFKLQDALSLVMRQEYQIEQFRLKNQYLECQIEKSQEELASTKNQLEQLQGNNKHLKKKVESLMEAQSKTKNQAYTAEMEQIKILNFNISKQKQEQAVLQRYIQKLQKEKGVIKMQLKQLIEENTCIRSKQKSSKHQLKLQIVQLKKLVNRFTEMITQKDMQLQNIKLANKTLNQALQQFKNDLK